MTKENSTPSFQLGATVVYPNHGVGVITAIEEQEVAGFKLELLAITFEKDRLTVRIPLAKAESSGLRKLSEPAVVKEALEILSTKAKAKKGMWNRRANDFQERMGMMDGDSVGGWARVQTYRSLPSSYRTLPRRKGR